MAGKPKCEPEDVAQILLYEALILAQAIRTANTPFPSKYGNSKFAPDELALVAGLIKCRSLADMLYRKARGHSLQKDDLGLEHLDSSRIAAPPHSKRARVEDLCESVHKFVAHITSARTVRKTKKNGTWIDVGHPKKKDLTECGALILNEVIRILKLPKIEHPTTRRGKQYLQALLEEIEWLKAAKLLT